MHLLHSADMVQFYRRACTHAVRLQSFLSNKINLRGQWCDTMLQELKWFMSQMTLGTSLSHALKDASNRLTSRRSRVARNFRHQYKSKAKRTPPAAIHEIQVRPTLA